jgi:GNAT superfamily N-acetyltransferase
MAPVTTLTFAPEPPDGDLAADLLGRYFRELDSRFPDGFDAARTVAAPSAELVPPYGTFLVARLDGRAVGCGAVRLLDDVTAEIKRMWIDPDARGHGVGRGTLAALEDAARTLGAKVARLDTSAHLAEAIGLYRSAGYVEIPAYNDNEYAAHWMEKPLG